MLRSCLSNGLVLRKVLTSLHLSALDRIVQEKLYCFFYSGYGTPYPVPRDPVPRTPYPGTPYPVPRPRVFHLACVVLVMWLVAALSLIFLRDEDRVHAMGRSRPFPDHLLSFKNHAWLFECLKPQNALIFTVVIKSSSVNVRGFCVKIACEQARGYGRAQQIRRKASSALAVLLQ